MSTLLLTGGTGFLGRHILDMLDKEFSDELSEFTTVRLMLRSPKKAEDISLENFEIEIVEGDLFKPDTIRNAAEGIDAVIHVAAIYNTSSPKKDFFKANVDGTEVLLEAIPEDAPVVLTSTYGVYGFDTPKEPITEDYEPKQPFWHYQTSKHAQEEKAFEISEKRGLKLTAIRPPTILGPGDYFFVPSAVDSIQNNDVAILKDDGKNKLPMAHVEDVARAHLLALANIDTAKGEPYHLSGFEPEFKELMDYFAKNIGEDEINRKIPYRLAYALGWIADKTPIPLPLSRFEVKFLASHCELNTSKIEEDLGWNPAHGMEETIDECIEWYEEEQPEVRA